MSAMLTTTIFERRTNLAMDSVLQHHVTAFAICRVSHATKVIQDI